MKEKKLTLTSKNISQKQWSNLVLELNLIKKAWKSFGVRMDLKAPGIKSIIEWGNRTGDYVRPGKKK